MRLIYRDGAGRIDEHALGRYWLASRARHQTRYTLRLLDLAKTQTAAIPHHGADIRRITARGKIAAVLDLDGDFGVLRELHRGGFRVMQLSAHNWANNFAELCCAEFATRSPYRPSPSLRRITDSSA